MILDRILPPVEARLLPVEKLHAPTVAVMAIMTFAMTIVAAAGLALAGAAALVTSGVESRHVIELPAAAAGQLPGAVSAARSAPGVVSARPIPEREMRKTLERWLGPSASSQDLPVPALVMLEVRPGTDVAALAAAVRRQVPSARIVSQAAELRPLLRSIRSLQWLAMSLVLLMAAATAAAVVLAARGALDTHRSTIEIMHGIGATDAQIVRLFERKIGVDSIAGAALGAAAAALALALVGAAGAALADNLGAIPAPGPADLLVLAAIPVIAVIVAVAVARWTLLGALRASL